MKIMLKTLFTKPERFLIHNNKRFVITSDESDKSVSLSTIKKENIQKKSEFLGHRFEDLIEKTGIPLAVETDHPEYVIAKRKKTRSAQSESILDRRSSRFADD